MNANSESYISKLNSILVVSLLLGCSISPTGDPGSPNTSLPRITSSVLPTQTASITTKPESANNQARVLKHCADVIDTFPKKFLSDGPIILRGASNLYEFYADDSLFHTIDAKWLASARVSPNHELLVWVTEIYDADRGYVGSSLQIQNGPAKFASHLNESDWGYFRGWLDNNHILMASKESPIEKIYAIDISTFESQTLLINYAGSFFTAGPNPSDRLIPTWDVSFTPDLSSVAYLSYSPAVGLPGVTLRNLTTDKEVWQSNYLQAVRLFPHWSPDGNRIAIAYEQMDNFVARSIHEFHSEILLVDKSGVETQLTQYKDSYPFNRISEISWSPDGNYLGFWMQVGEDEPAHLMILNIATQQTIDYCIPGNISGPPPVWSPDSTQLALVNMYERGQDYFVFDIREEIAVKISEDGFGQVHAIAGWMQKP